MRRLICVLFFVLSICCHAYPPNIAILFDGLEPKLRSTFVSSESGALTEEGRFYLNTFMKGRHHDAALMLGVSIPSNSTLIDYLDKLKTPLTPVQKVLAKSFIFSATVEFEGMANDMVRYLQGFIENIHNAVLPDNQFNRKLLKEFRTNVKRLDSYLKPRLLELTELPLREVQRLLRMESGKIEADHLKYFVFQKGVDDELQKFGKRLGIDSRQIIRLGSDHAGRNGMRTVMGATRANERVFRVLLLRLCLKSGVL